MRRSRPPGERSIYTPADFAQYAPRTALDMLQQIPGFNIETQLSVRAAGSGRPAATCC